MASSIPKAYKKEIADTIAAETLKVALFISTGWVYSSANAAHNTYAAIKAAGCTEVSSAGTGYTTGGVALAPTSSYITNDAGVFNVATSISSATFTCRYAVVYETTGGKIRAVVDLGGDVPVSNGTLTITWDATDGIIKVSSV